MSISTEMVLTGIALIAIGMLLNYLQRRADRRGDFSDDWLGNELINHEDEQRKVQITPVVGRDYN